MGNCDQSAYLNRKKENALANIKVKETSSSAEIHVQKSEKEKTSMKEDSLIPDLNAFQSQK